MNAFMYRVCMHGNTTNIMYGARHERSDVLVELV
jgi:hypothetical protein